MKQIGVRMSVSRALLRAALVIAVAGLLPACSRGHDDQQKGAPRKLRVVLMPFLSFAPLIIADTEGYFAEQGLDIEFVRVTRLTDAVPLLLSGAIDVLPGTALPGALNAMARDEQIRIVADKGYLDPRGCTNMAIMAQPGHSSASTGARSVRRISSEREAPSLYITRRALEYAGISIDSLQVLQIPHAPEMEALASGSIDAAFAGEPWLSRIVRNQKGVIWIPAQLAVPDFQFSFIFYGPNLVRHDRDAGRRFMVAYRKGIRRYREGKTPRNVAILAKATAEDPEFLKANCWLDVRENSRINLGSLLDFQQWAKAQGFVPKAATPAQLWDSSFVVYADSVLSGRSN